MDNNKRKYKKDAAREEKEDLLDIFLFLFIYLKKCFLIQKVAILLFIYF